MQTMHKTDLQRTLTINEIFYSIQGESTHAGRPCVFIRLTGCNLRCTYCDTAYAFYEGEKFTLQTITERIQGYGCKLVEITGGEPLLQSNVHFLMEYLCELGFEVLLETGGQMDISDVDSRVRRIMDLKCPSSGESEKMLWSNIKQLNSADEIKFVVGNRGDYLWAKEKIERYGLPEICAVLMAPVFNQMDSATLAAWILEDRLPVRMQLQMHKLIWGPERRGV